MGHPAASIAELRAAVRRRKVSPVELVERALADARREQPRLNAFIALMEEDALRAARRIERQVMARRPVGLLAGAPISVKDLMFTRGTPTTAGSRAFPPDYGADRDAPVVARLRRAGAVIMGRTNLHEVALGVTSVNEHFGAVRNPWDTSRVAGGSSGGSAAAVAAGLGLASVGSDTRGSIRIPASCCGISGLKPSRGRVDLRDVVPLAPSLDHVGPMARTAEDAALLLAAMIGGRSGERVLRESRAPARTLVLGVSSYHMAGLEAPIERVLDRAIAALRPLVRDVRAVAISLSEAHVASGIVAGSEAFAFHEPLLAAAPGGYGPIVRQRLEGGATWSAAQYLRARGWLDGALASFVAAFEEVDLLLGAVLPHAPPSIASQLADPGAVAATVSAFTRYTAPQNMAGVPAMSVPCGFVDGIPVGLQVIGPPGADGRVLALARAFQRETDWHLAVPRDAAGHGAGKT